MNTLLAVIVSLLVSAFACHAGGTILFMVFHSLARDSIILPVIIRVGWRAVAGGVAVYLACSWFKRVKPLSLFLGYAVITALFFSWALVVSTLRMYEETDQSQGLWRTMETAGQGIAMIVGAYIGKRTFLPSTLVSDLRESHILGLIGSTILALSPMIWVETHPLGGTTLWTIAPMCSVFMALVGVLAFVLWKMDRARLAVPLSLLGLVGLPWAIIAYRAAQGRVMEMSKVADPLVASFAQMMHQHSEIGGGWIRLTVGILLLIAEVVLTLTRKQTNENPGAGPTLYNPLLDEPEDGTYDPAGLHRGCAKHGLGERKEEGELGGRQRNRDQMTKTHTSLVHLIGGSLLPVVYLIGNIGTFGKLTFFDGYQYSWWNWIIVVPINECLAAIWPIYWLVLRPLFGH